MHRVFTKISIVEVQKIKLKKELRFAGRGDFRLLFLLYRLHRHAATNQVTSRATALIIYSDNDPTFFAFIFFTLLDHFFTSFFIRISLAADLFMIFGVTFYIFSQGLSGFQDWSFPQTLKRPSLSL
jgi:hypothetical protein